MFVDGYFNDVFYDEELEEVEEEEEEFEGLGFEIEVFLEDIFGELVELGICFIVVGGGGVMVYDWKWLVKFFIDCIWELRRNIFIFMLIILCRYL